MPTPCKFNYKAKKKRVYLYSKNNPLRSKVDYDNAVKIAEATQQVFQGCLIYFILKRNPRGKSWLRSFTIAQEKILSFERSERF